MSFHENLITLLKTHDAFVDIEGDLLQSAVIDAAYKINPDLIKLLISDPSIKKKFFSEIAEHRVFDINTFVDYVADKNFLNDSYTKFKNKIGLTIDGKSLRERGEVALVRPYKDCILEGGMTKEDQKRKEIFFNQVLAQDEIDKLLEPKLLTNWKRYTTQGEEAVGDIKRNEEGIIRENLIIKGNNLLALHSLKKEFTGRVKLIYIDPPYNTGSDSFGYNDNFNHSTWLTFMKNRLEVARELLSPKGSIFVSINNIELGYILVLMDEIFGKQNKLPIVTLKAGTTASYRSINECPVNVTEYVISYKKDDYESNSIYEEATYSEDYGYYISNIKDNSEKREIKNINDIIHEQEGCLNWREFRKKIGPQRKKIRFERKEKFALENANITVSLNTLQKPSTAIQEIIDQSKIERNKVFELKRKNGSSIYCYNGRTLAFFEGKFKEIDGEYLPAEILTNLWTDVSFLGIGPEGGVNLPNGKKPEQLIKKIIDLTTKEGDIVLDYHLGSGTTAAVAHKLNRQYIGIEQLFYGDNDSTIRLENVIKGDSSGISDELNRQGGGDFVYFELAKHNENFIDHIQEAQDTEALLTIRENIKGKSFLDRNVDLSELETAMEEFMGLSLDKQKQALVELLNKNQLYINLSDRDDQDFAISEEDKEMNRKFYQL